MFQSVALQGEPHWASTVNWASTALVEGAGTAEITSSSGFMVLVGHQGTVCTQIQAGMKSACIQCIK